MSVHLGSYNTATTRTHVRFQFTTHAAAGGTVAPSSAFEAADLRIYRANDGAAFSATQRSSANGITMTSPFDSVTGLHDVDIDLTDNTDSGFYAAGYLYAVVIVPDETVDSQTVAKVLAYFEIGPPPVNVTQLGGSSQSLTDLKDFADSGYDPDTNKVEGVKLVDTLTTYTGNTVQTGDAYAIVNSGTHGNAALKSLIDAVDNFVDTEVADIQSRLPAALVGGRMDANAGAISGDATAADNLEAAYDGVGYAHTGNTYPWTAAWDAEVQSEVDDALVAQNLDHLVKIAVDTDFATTVHLNSVIGHLADNGTSASFDRATMSLEALLAENDATQALVTAAAIRAALGLASANLDTQLASLSTKLDTIDDFLDTELAAVLAAVDTEIAAIQTAVVTSIPATLASLLTTAMTEGYRADGATGSVRDLLYEIKSQLGEFAISGITKTNKKIDGTTTSFLETLDSSTAPTSVTRSS